MLLFLFPLLFLPSYGLLSHCQPKSKCQCPPIGYIDQSGIANSEYGSYLANRTTTRPKVKVSDECLIVADVSALHTPNHFLMLFRTAAPPIFAKRLSESSDKVINLTDIHCVENNDGQFNWMYYGGVVNDLSVAVQSNEGMCECSDKWQSHRVTISNQTCDIFEVQCIPLNGTFRAVFFSGLDQFAAAPNRSLVVDELTCVSGSWYYASYKLTPYFLCYPDDIDTSECGCLNFVALKPGDRKEYTYTIDGAFADYSRSTGVASYTGCSAELTCPANQTLVIFPIVSEPLIYPPGTKPTITCASSPLATSSLSMKQLFVDGIVVSEPSYACYEKRCPCSFAFLRSYIIPNYAGNHPFLQNLTSAVYDHPPYTGELTDYCPTYMECANYETLVNLETNDTARVISTEPYQSSDYARVNISCSASTGKWMINGEEHNRLYAICVVY